MGTPPAELEISADSPAQRARARWAHHGRDWGDMAEGDRATDLAAVWMLLPQLETRRRAMAAIAERTIKRLMEEP
jgi:hypothetical protein